MAVFSDLFQFRQVLVGSLGTFLSFFPIEV